MDGKSEKGNKSEKWREIGGKEKEQSVRYG